MARLGLLWQLATTGGVPRSSLYVGLVVGTILNLINQYDALLGPVAVDWVKLGLTYCVPYCVSTYGAVMAKLHALKIAAAR